MSPAFEEISQGIHQWVNSTHDVGVTFFPGADPAFITLPLGEACGYPQTEHARVIKVDFKLEPCLLLSAALHTAHLALINLSQLLSLLSSNYVIL